MKSAGRTPETAPKPAPEPGGHFFILFAAILWGTSGTVQALAEPLTASLLGIFFLHEDLTPNTLEGIVLIFTAQVILSTGRHRTDRS